MREAFANREVIEDYPGDKHGPSCLILGMRALRGALHIFNAVIRTGNWSRTLPFMSLIRAAGLSSRSGEHPEPARRAID